MSKPRIVRDYRTSSAIKKEARAASVLKGMSNNKSFPSPPVKMTELAKTKDQYTAARIDAQNRDRLKSNDKNKIAAVLIAQLDQLADYVIEVGNDDASIYLSSGYEIKTTPVATGFGPIPDFTVKVGNISGQAIVSCGTVDNATGYAVHYALVTDEGLIWKPAVVGSVTKYLIEDLEPGKTYVFFMEAVGTKKKSVKSEEVRRVIP